MTSLRTTERETLARAIGPTIVLARPEDTKPGIPIGRTVKPLDSFTSTIAESRKVRAESRQLREAIKKSCQELIISSNALIENSNRLIAEYQEYRQNHPLIGPFLV